MHRDAGPNGEISGDVVDALEGVSIGRGKVTRDIGRRALRNSNIGREAHKQASENNLPHHCHQIWRIEAEKQVLGG